MKESDKKEPTALMKWWDSLETGMKFSVCWLFMVFVALVVIGIIFPIAGIVMVAFLAAITTFGVIAYLMDEY